MGWGLLPGIILKDPLHLARILEGTAQCLFTTHAYLTSHHMFIHIPCLLDTRHAFLF
jgi:hypothetical protein